MTGAVFDDSSLTEFLIGLGWAPGCRQDIGEVVLAWTAHGYTESDAAVSFVRQFNGISFEYPRHVVVGGSHRCVIDAVRAASAVSPSRVSDYERRAGQILTPVGLAASNHVVLMVADSGKVYGGYDNYLAIYGDDGKAALWNIYHRIDSVQLPVA